MTKYIIFGASGMVGAELVKICEAKNLDYIGVYRKTPKYLNINQSKAWIGNIEDFPPQLFNNSHIFCCIGSSIESAKSEENFLKIAVDLPISIAKNSSINNALSFNIISGAFPSSKSKILYVKAKGLLEEQLLPIKFKNLNIFRPSFLKGNRVEFRLNEKIILFILKPLNFIFNLPFLLKFKLMPSSLLAKAMLYVAQNYSGVNIFNNYDIHKLKNKI